MSELVWLVGRSFQSLTRRDWEWILVLDENVQLVISCLWRLVEDGRIRVTGEDDGQKLGLPAPVDAAAEVNRCLAGATVEAVDLRRGTLDLDLRFTTGHVLQIIPDSLGYEAWILYDGSRQVIAVGGGELAVFGGDPFGG